jgi:uncharacterized phage-associated protein
MATANQVADYILGKIDAEAGDAITHLKLQKVIYYCQAWHLALFGEPLFKEEVQAWQHGPVVRSVWNRFSDNGWHALSPEMRNAASDKEFTKKQRELMDEVWEAYGQLSGSQLRTLTHREEPWKATRGDLPEECRSDRVIKKELMRDFYRQTQDN